MFPLVHFFLQQTRSERSHKQLFRIFTSTFICCAKAHAGNHAIQGHFLYRTANHHVCSSDASVSKCRREKVAQHESTALSIRSRSHSIISSVHHISSVRIDPSWLRVHASTRVAFLVDGLVVCKAEIAESCVTLRACMIWSASGISAVGCKVKFTYHLVASPKFLNLLATSNTRLALLRDHLQARVLLLFATLPIGCACLAFVVGPIAWHARLPGRRHQ